MTFLNFDEWLNQQPRPGRIWYVKNPNQPFVTGSDRCLKKRNGFQQITEANIRLVVPKPIHSKYPKEVQPGLMTLQEFIDEVESL